MGPLERGKLGTISPRGRAQDARVFFARPRLANLEGRSPEGAFAGWPSLCLLLSWPHKRKWVGPPAGRNETLHHDTKCLKRSQKFWGYLRVNRTLSARPRVVERSGQPRGALG